MIRHRSVLVVLAAVALVLPLAPTPPGAVAADGPTTRLYLPLLQRPDQIIFVSDRDSGSTIVEVAADGSGRRTLSGPTTNDARPLVSPDGQHVAFVSTRDSRFALYVMASDGTGQRKLADCDVCDGISWTADSRRVFIARPSYTPSSAWVPEEEARLVSLDGSPEVKVPRGAALSPDGMYIAYRSFEGGVTQLLARPLTGGKPIVLATDLPFNPAISWSPDSTLLAYRDVAGAAEQLVVVGLDGRQPQVLGSGREPRWAPDSTAIAFLAQQPGKPDSLVVMSVGGGAPATRVPNASRLLGWSPDGQQLAYITTRSPDRLMLVRRSGEAPVAVKGPASITAFSWAPDSSAAAVTGYTDTHSDLRIYAFARDGSGVRELGPGSDELHWRSSTHLISTNQVSVPTRLYHQVLGEPHATPLGEGSDIALSPDGRRLAYLRGQRLVVAGADGTGETQPAGALQVLAQAVWAPDGRRLALVAAEGSQGQAIYVLDLRGGGPKRITGCERVCWAPAWSPEGGRILFSVSTSALAGPIYVAAADGSWTRLVGTGTEPVWSPGGDQIAYMDADLFVMRADGTGARRLAPCAGGPVWCNSPSWSPDGSQLSFVLSDESNEYRTVYSTVVVSAADGTKLGQFEGREQSWWQRSTDPVRPCQVTFGFVPIAHREFFSWYWKLSFDDGRSLIPSGHGNVVQYVVVRAQPAPPTR